MLPRKHPPLRATPLLLLAALVAPACRPPCSTPADCAEGETCTGGQCEALCFRDTDCAGGLTCQSRLCLPPPTPRPPPPAPDPNSSTLQLFEATYSAALMRYELQPLQGVPVLFHRADGEPFAANVTDEEGRVGTVLPEDGWVTLARPGWGLQTTLLRRGETRLIGSMPPLPGDASLTADVVNYPSAPVMGHVRELRTGCSYDGGFGFAAFGPSCLDAAGHGTALATLVDEQNRVITAFSLLTGIDVTQRPLIVSLPPWRSDWAHVRLAVEGAPPELNGLTVTTRELRDGVPFGYDVVSANRGTAALAAGAASATVALVPGLATHLERRFHLSGPLPGAPLGAEVGSILVDQAELPRAEEPAPFSRFLPVVTRAALSDDARVLEVEGGWAPEVDALQVYLGCRRQAWTILLPAPSGTIRLPVLTEALVELRGSCFELGVSFLDAAELDGHLAYRDRVDQSGVLEYRAISFARRALP